ncbi:MAG: type IX secretion system sortase PorU [Bacteroidetes bacterium]|nr:type IX secretion system sortase PorU [Bacteroidota bacterium]
MRILFPAIIFLSLSFFSKDADAQELAILPSEIHEGYFVKDLPLQHFAQPIVQISDAQYAPVSSVPKKVQPNEVSHYSTALGQERKQAFIRLRIPAYTINAEGQAQRLQSLSIKITEQEQTNDPKTHHPLAKTSATSAPLSAGTWYKIGLVDRGVYKIDYNFIKSLGLTPESINPANIRLVGNAGGIISENNAENQVLGLSDIATWVNDGGDGKIDAGDFIAFFARGNMLWVKDSLQQRFLHVQNIYADSSYYFISFDAGNGTRISQAPAVAQSNETVSSFNDYAVHELDLYNPGAFGKEWWGEQFGLGAQALPTRSFSFPLGGMIDTLGYRITVASRSTMSGNKINLSINSQPSGTFYFNPVSLEPEDNPLSSDFSDKKMPLFANQARFDLNYVASSDAIGYLNFIELNWRRPLAFDQGNFSFRDWRSVGSGKIARYSINNAASGCQVWDVTNPTQPQFMPGNLNGTTFSFNQTADYLHEFVALNGNDFAQPYFVKKIDNQNLMGAAIPTLTIVTFPDFLDAANQLADFHRTHDGMNVLVTTTEQVYNEFSSGGQDISAIRNMMRYYYNEAGNDTSLLPKYLLLFGDASYDYKNRIDKNSNFVPSFESPSSEIIGNCFTVDDFYGFLDPNEDMNNYSIPNTLDIGVGRIPVNTPQQAEDAVNKILAYTDKQSLGPWRINDTYIADNEDGAGYHAEDAEAMAAVVNQHSPFSNETKIYLDNLPFVATPGGERCPDANKAINDQIFKGTFLINYSGHGSTVTLAHERILTSEDFNKWQNQYKLPFMVTATCDYARYDNPAYVSNGEQMILQKNAGTIAMLTTTGPVYASINRSVNAQFLASQYTQSNGIWPTFGDAIRKGKNITFSQSTDFFTLLNFYRFTLLGDPALQPAFPKYKIATDSIINTIERTSTDTFKALGNYTIVASVLDNQGQMLQDFNGRAYVTIFDKKRTISTFTKDNGQIQPPVPVKWDVQDNVIFKGITTVENGKFSVSFIAPKDMDYSLGTARISYYAENGETDAAGVDTSVLSGSFIDGGIVENDPPIVQPFIGDTLFQDGGLTGTNTRLYVKLSDESGINASGNSVGHDITAVLDDDESTPYILNDYYETEPNTYKRGHVSFPISGLANGKHSFRVKAWDVFNNSGSGTVNFIVVDGKMVQVDDLVNYPNPFSTSTHFFFEHNHPNEHLNVQIAIYNLQGMLVKIINQDFVPSGSKSNEIIWDGRDDHGALLRNGVYPYRLMLSTPSGNKGMAYQKLVIMR